MYDVRTPEKAPPPTGSGRRYRRYPWAQIPPGGSFVVPIETGEDPTKVAASIQSAGIAWCKRNAQHLRVVIRTNSKKREVAVWLVNNATHDKPLPEDFPAKRELGRAGITTISALLRFLQGGDLTELNEIGDTKAEEIIRAAKLFQE